MLKISRGVYYGASVVPCFWSCLRFCLMHVGLSVYVAMHADETDFGLRGSQKTASFVTAFPKHQTSAGVALL